MVCQYNPRIQCNQKTGCSMCGVFLHASQAALEDFHLKFPIPEALKAVKI